MYKIDGIVYACEPKELYKNGVTADKENIE
jgi:hypothetical protein